MCFASASNSEGDSGVGGEVRGFSPLLTSSPEVFTWMKTLSGVVREGGRCLFKAVAVLADVRVCIAYMFGVTVITCLFIGIQCMAEVLTS